MEPSWSFNSDVNMTGFDTPNVINVLSFAMDRFTGALVDDASYQHKFANL
jgi:hypothetical protein